MSALQVLSSCVDPDTTLFFTLATVFNFFASIGVFSIAVTLAPALLSSRVKRSRTWFGVLAAWLLYSLSYILLIGNQFGPEPPLGLCIFQAEFIYATTPLCAVATTCFAIDFFLKLSRVKVKGKAIGRRTANMLVILPWILGLMIIAEAILSVHDVAGVQRDTCHFYCHIIGWVPSITNIIIVICFCLIMIILEICTAILLYRNWAVFELLDGNDAQIALSTFLRLALFSTIVIFSLAISVFYAAYIGKAIPAFSIVLTTLPTLFALCFGTQRDILGAWLFWKKSEPIPPVLTMKIQITRLSSANTQLDV